MLHTSTTLKATRRRRSARVSSASRASRPSAAALPTGASGPVTPSTTPPSIAEGRGDIQSLVAEPRSNFDSSRSSVDITDWSSTTSSGNDPTTYPPSTNGNGNAAARPRSARRSLVYRMVSRLRFGPTLLLNTAARLRSARRRRHRPVFRTVSTLLFGPTLLLMGGPTAKSGGNITITSAIGFVALVFELLAVIVESSSTPTLPDVEAQTAFLAGHRGEQIAQCLLAVATGLFLLAYGFWTFG